MKLRNGHGRIRIYRRPGERHVENCVCEQDSFGGWSVMIWAGISMQMKTDAVVVNGNLNSRRYQDQIITPVIIPHIRANRGMTLVQDNAPCHTARTTKQRLQHNNIRMLPWHARSPDLSPIKPVWGQLKHEVWDLPQPVNLRARAYVVVQVWRWIPQDYIGSMRARCNAVIAARCGHKKY